MNILAIETSAGEGSIALQTGDEVRERVLAVRQHTEQIIDSIDTLLTDTGLTLSELATIGFGRGPGSFIGVRLAAAVALFKQFAKK